MPSEVHCCKCITQASQKAPKALQLSLVPTAGIFCQVRLESLSSKMVVTNFAEAACQLMQHHQHHQPGLRVRWKHACATCTCYRLVQALLVNLANAVTHYTKPAQPPSTQSVTEQNMLLGFCIAVETGVCPAGCADSSLCVWSTATGSIVHVLKGHAGIPTSIQWHPRRMLVASACNALALWTPDPKSLAQSSYNFALQ